MTEIAEMVTAAGRLDRVLDAAAELLVRWGYRRVTIEDVAGRAGIGKGTVYLHFHSKEALFLTVVLRGHHGVVTAMVERMRADPVEVLPARMMRSLFLALTEDPVTRALYLGDGETLGRLAHEAADTLGELGRRRDAVVGEHLCLLRTAGLLRSDLDIGAQQYLLGAVATGFYFVEPLDLPTAPPDVTGRAEILQHTLAHALHAAGAPSPDAGLAEAVAERYESLIEHIDAEWQRRVR